MAYQLDDVVVTPRSISGIDAHGNACCLPLMLSEGLYHLPSGLFFRIGGNGVLKIQDDAIHR